MASESLEEGIVLRISTIRADEGLTCWAKNVSLALGVPSLEGPMTV